ncbi:MAG: metallophosphoesterase family protein [Gemmatimonadota bacterium]|nr:metallophosphoesterase family protein [Gemmatimonadota bacterium]
MAPERRDGGTDRRDDVKRRRVEMVLDQFFRPVHWATHVLDALGLQSGRPTRVDRQQVSAARHAGARPLRVVFASDFHAGATTAERVIADACAALDALEPDVLLLGGDFVSVRANDIHSLAPLLATVRAPLGKFGVYGNHDLRANRPVIAEALAAAGVRMLVNEVEQLPAPHDDVSIVGLDDPIRGTPRGEILDAAGGVRILLMHAPDGLLAAGDRHFDLAVCGHTHGGQIVLPGGLIPYLPHGELSRTYPVGVYQLEPDSTRTLLVSRGIGCSTLPMRLLCPSEVHVITIAGGGS